MDINEIRRLSLLYAQGIRPTAQLAVQHRVYNLGHEFTYKEYDDYLRSKEWKELREKAFLFYGRRCQVCGTAKRIQVHHRHYYTLTREDVKDVMVLCYYCHANMHGKKRQS